MAIRGLSYYVGRHIKRIRIQRGLSQQEVAQGARISTVQFRKIEKGEGNPELSTLSNIAFSLEVDIGEFFKETEEECRPASFLRHYEGLFDALPRQARLSVCRTLDFMLGHEEDGQKARFYIPGRVIYRIKEEKRPLDEAWYQTYGIAAYVAAGHDDFLVEEIDDILPDRQLVQALVERLNEYELSPIHLKDVVEDFLAESLDGTA